MATPDTFEDPLRINLAQQIRFFSEQLPRGSSYLESLQNARSRPGLLKELSRLLSAPGLSETVARLFKPLLLDLCARWLEEETELEAKFEASALLLEIHPEIFSVFSKLLSHPYFANGPLGFTKDIHPIASVEAVKFHRILLAYYRVLHANSELPRTSSWSLTFLSRLIWERHPDPGVRFLAIRCYALQSGMMEGERLKMEKEVLGELESVDCPVTWDPAADGSRPIVDGWILPIKETRRVLETRAALLPTQKYYTYEDGDSVEPIHPAELSPLITNVCGVLMLRSSNSSSPNSPLVPTPTASQALCAIASHLIPNIPTLLTSAPSSGKALLLSHLASLLHPDRSNQIVTIHLADTSLDPRSLLGSYVSSPTRSGTFEWKEGVLVKAMREGRWVVFEDIDRGSSEVLGLIKPLIESLGLEKWIGGQAEIDIPSRGMVRAAEGFSIFATRSIQSSRDGKFPPPTFFGSHKFFEIVVDSPTYDDLCAIVDVRFPRLAGAVGNALIQVWDVARQLGASAASRDIGTRELQKLCARVEKILPPSYQPMDIDFDAAQPPSLSSLFPNSIIREDIFFECRDVFFGAGAITAGAQAHLTAISANIAEQLGLSEERRDWVLHGRTPDYLIDKDVNGVVTSVTLGRTRLAAIPTKQGAALPATRSFAMHKPAISLLSRIASAISLCEPVLLTGETGTGKTSVVTHLASLLRQPLISLNLSNQSESSDIIGGFRPVDARIPAVELYERFLELFGGTFSRKKNAHFEESVRKAVQEGKWKRAVTLWSECVRLAKDRIYARRADDSKQSAESQAPRKRRKTDDDVLKVSGQSWLDFERDVQTFDVQHIQGNGKFAFAFVEGPLVKALRLGHWILLDEINLASAETLECVSSLLHGPTASITLTEQGSLEPVPRHPNFRLFACMNPATDVGKKDLPPNIRSRFTEIDVPPPDDDRDTLLSIVSHYIGLYAVGDKGAIMDVAEFYISVRTLAGKREIADGSNHKPHFSMRTLARALTFAADLSTAYSLRRALWEGCLMAFTMALDSVSALKVTALAQRHILAGVRNVRSLLMKEPSPPQGRPVDEFIKFGPFYLERGPLPEDSADEYIITPSVETKLIDLARIVVTRKFPVLIEGPTSSGKTSSVEYLAKRTGHRFVRINNHEHTDIQEYLGTYVSDHATGKLVFKDGLLVRALRNGDWIVLDELNLAPTDVLEALNRLLDDNRELIVPETQEVVKPHPHFMLFATQNPSGLYGGRKVLSRAFRNRFLEVHFEDVPQGELETILCQRCRIAPSYGQRIVEVFQELQKHRQSSRIFESKHGFATLRDLFRWAGRDAMSYQELADNGYMLLAERVRREEDKTIVKGVLESVMKVSIDPERLYDLQGSATDVAAYLGISLPTKSSLVWTSAMKRLFTLVARALRFNEPLLLVGETGCGKTSVCQVFAEITDRKLHAVNCHQNTETADLIGSLRPLRNRSTLETEAISEAIELLQSLGCPAPDSTDVTAITNAVFNLSPKLAIDNPSFDAVRTVSNKLHRLAALFEWHDGPLIHAMRTGDVFLMDEISLADDSVLERLNSVLEPGRTIVLAEQGGAEELPAIRAAEGFKLVATMNPGGDFGKKELSPALRNRFTEIWVPAVEARSDLELIVQRSWKHDSLQHFTAALLDFTDWLSARIGERSIITLRDILAWVEFVNVTFEPSLDNARIHRIFHHAAHMTFLDGLGSLPQLSAYSAAALAELKKEAVLRLDSLFPAPPEYNSDRIKENEDRVQLGTFSISRGSIAPNPSVFSIQAPTTQDNVNRVVRACQLAKPILLEGSPGVGKTSLVLALANICGHRLCRINLSDQTDLMDLFGSDLPVEGGAPGQFAWKDADFLRALQEGHWVLLDEMNLAPQAVLEGLNAVLDHRGTVYIPELGRSFARHPSFRIFAAQNPLHQGGGRKGLPKSFLNRFTKVYVEELTAEDKRLICRAMFPAIPGTDVDGMLNFTARLYDEAMVKHAFAREGAPWEFNLRDILRWGTLIQQALPSYVHPVEFLHVLFLQRFRSHSDRDFARSLFYSVFPNTIDQGDCNPAPILSPHCVQVGRSVNSRYGHTLGKRSPGMLHAHMQALQALGTCVANRWLAILTGQRNSGKNWVVRQMAHLTGRTLHEISVNSATDASDLLGSFEEVDAHARLRDSLRSLLGSLEDLSALLGGSQLTEVLEFTDSVRLSLTHDFDRSIEDIITKASKIKADLDHRFPDQLSSLKRALESLSFATKDDNTFEWVDGPLVRALKAGHWVLLDGANLCNPSVLDRLNALCEIGGKLTLNEKGAVNGLIETIAPHPAFRLFMSVDHHFGELSRAMRNRGVEIALVTPASSQDRQTLSEYLRITDFPRLKEPNVIRNTTPLENGLQISATQSVCSTSSARLLPEDSVASKTSDLASIFLDLPPPSPYPEGAGAYVVSYAISPSVLHPVRRLLLSLVDPEARPVALLDTIANLTYPHVVEEAIRARIAGDANISRDHLLSQCLDWGLYPDALSQKTSTVRTLLQVVAALATFPPVIRQSLPEKHTPSSEERMRDNISGLAVTIHSTASAIYRHIDTASADSEKILALTFRLLSYANYLSRSNGEARLDHSAIYTASRWLDDALQECGVEFVTAQAEAKALSEAIALTSGHGLSELWSSLSMPAIEDVLASKIEALVAVAHVLPHDLIGLRRKFFDLINLLSLPSIMSSDREEAILKLMDHLHSQLPDLWSQAAHDIKPYQVQPMYLIAELNVISRLHVLRSSQTGLFREGATSLIGFAMQDSESDISRFVHYQQALWLDDTDQMSPRSTFVIHSHWLQGIWDGAPVNELDGPTVLLKPTMLLTTVSQCNHAGQSLQRLMYEEETLERHFHMLAVVSTTHRTRLYELESILLQLLITLFSCFSETFEDHDAAYIRALSLPTKTCLQEELVTVVSLLGRSNHTGLRLAVEKYLNSTLSSRDEIASAEKLNTNLGRLWIGLSRLLLDLFVPNIPIDPSALQRCAIEFGLGQRALFEAQIAMLRDFVERTQGNSSSETIRYLQTQAEAISVASAPTSIRTSKLRRDLGRLHTYWAEIQQFIAQVLPESKLSTLLNSASLDSSVSSRELVVQASITTFCRRLSNAYSDFQDINSLLQTALHAFKLGLRLVTASASTSEETLSSIPTAALEKLSAFPSISSAELSHNLADEGDPAATISTILTKLTAIACGIALGGDIRRHLSSVGVLYEQVYGLWSIDRAREADREREAQSLYRKHEDNPTDADFEEQDFLAIFPEFGDLLEESDTSPHVSSTKATVLVSPAFIWSLMQVHEELFGSSRPSLASVTLRFEEQRRALARSVVQSNYSRLPERLDTLSLPFQLTSVNDALESLLRTPSTQARPYDFYFDENVPEARKAVDTIQTLIRRIDLLLQQWPDQMSSRQGPVGSGTVAS
ncbi:hypothetical protein BDY19DRAFT_324469 [Irpex rosettiformis]|uniref:Uncharacterized protein n=1 Tax=Irpex rosettiformis TaxID=378272 RepID=A0ACB8TYG0_9APHY|nr:hypothetical protein BDY19DRAFT_324469 [Irpex rosettiformis]